MAWQFLLSLGIKLRPKMQYFTNGVEMVSNGFMSIFDLQKPIFLIIHGNQNPKPAR